MENETHIEAPSPILNKTTGQEPKTGMGNFFTADPAESKEAKADKPAKPLDKTEPKEDHVAIIGELARQMKATKPGVETFAVDILYHVAALQDPETYDAAYAAKQKATAEADALSAKQRGRVKV